MTNRIITNSIRNIKKQFPRFVSLIIMSMLGVFAFTGLQATAPDMMMTLHQYLASHDTYDIKIISTLGLDDEDVKELKKIKNVSQAEGSYSKDTITEIHNIEYVLNVSSLSQKINTLTVLRGHLPKKNDEIVVEETMMNIKGLKLGDTITLKDDVFKEKNVKIVGVVDSALYYNFVGTSGGRGSTSVGSGTINYYSYVLASNFDQDYYSSIYCTVSNLDGKITGSEEYTDSVQEVVDRFNDIKEARQEARYVTVIGKATEEIESQKQEAYGKLDDANKELKSAKKKLEDADSILEESKATLIDSKAALDSAKKQLDDARRQLDSAKKSLEGYKKELDDGWQQLEKGRLELEEKKNELDNAKDTLDRSLVQIQEGEETLATNKQLLEESAGMNYEQVISTYSRLSWGANQVNQAKGICDQISNAESEEEVKELAGQLKDMLSSLDGIMNQISPTAWSIVKQMAANITKPTSRIVSRSLSLVLQPIQSILNSLQPAYEGALQIQEGEQILNQKKKEWEEGNQAYQDGLKLYEAGEKEYASNLALYNDKKKTYDDSYAQYLEKEKEYDKNYKKYLKGLISYQDGYNQYQSGLNEYESGKKEYLKNLDLYNDSKKEVDEKIEDAYKKLEDIQKPKWYVYDRTSYSTYSDYLDDANSISNLAGIFPVVFYAVAILISLISMNRMVEDDRVEIGTLKSLGFSNKQILWKYMSFSLLATVIGGIVGALVGITYLPYMINNIYTILFSLPDLIYLPNFTTTILGVFISILCVCGTTLYTTNVVLKEKPSELMRPKPPKNGQRVLIERTPIWKNLNFSQKIIVRNIFRYKKRVSVTILGITGCTALMLCGFGIKDSIVDIPTSQYGKVFTFDGYTYVNGKEEKLDAIFDHPDIESIVKIDAISTTLDNSKVTLFVTEDTKAFANIINLIDNETKEIDSIEKGKIVLTEKIAKAKNIHVGDTIELIDLNNKAYKLKVSSIVDNYVEHYAFIDRETLESLGEDFTCNLVYFHTKDHCDENKLSEDLLAHDEILNISYMSGLINKVGDMLKSLDKVVYILIILSALLSFVVLYNLSNININERKREIATLKVLGFTNKEVDDYITKENLILTVIGVFLGLIAGYFLTNIVVATVEIEKCRFIYQIKMMSYVYTVLFSFAFTFIVNFVAHFILKRIDMIESLKSVE